MGIKSNEADSKADTKDAEFNQADSKLAASTGARPEPGTFSFSRSLARFWREGRRHYGAWRTLRELASSFWRAMIELTPSRRQARYGDLDYDLEQSVNTTRANVPFKTQWMATLAGSPYYASDPWLFAEIMQALDSPPLKIRCEEFTFIDLGSGKGRALLMAAEHSFRRIIGVELMPELNQVCLENIRAFNHSNGPSSRLEAPCIEALCMDARDFQFPPEPLVIYLFNPFPEPVFAAVMENLRQSVLENPRPVFIAYRYIEHESLLAASDWLTKVAGTEQWVIYRNLVSGA
jgi:SAM-dependent methyltransferase